MYYSTLAFLRYENQIPSEVEHRYLMVGLLCFVFGERAPGAVWDFMFADRLARLLQTRGDCCTPSLTLHTRGCFLGMCLIGPVTFVSMGDSPNGLCVKAVWPNGSKCACLTWLLDFLLLL